MPVFEDNVVDEPEVATELPKSASTSSGRVSKPANSKLMPIGEINQSYIWSLENDYLTSHQAETENRPRSLTMRSIRMQALIFSDVLAVVVSVALAFCMAAFVRWSMGISAAETNIRLAESLGSMVGGGALFVCVYSWGLGHYTRFRPFWTEISEILKTVFYLAAFYFAYLFIIKIHFSRLWVVSALALLPIIVPLFRYMCRRALHLKGWWVSTYLHCRCW